MDNNYNDWQQMSPAWRDWELHRCLCGILDSLAIITGGTDGVTLTSVLATGAGTIPAGVVGYTVTNVGAAAGTFNAVSIASQQTISSSKKQNAAIAYNGTGTTLRIDYETLA